MLGQAEVAIMRVETAEERNVITHLSKDIVAEVAPEELELFDELMEEHFANPEASSTPTHSEDDALAFGLESAMTVLTPVVAAVVSAVVKYVVDEVLKATKDESSSFIREKVERLFGLITAKKSPEAAPAPGQPASASISLSPDELARVRQLALEQSLACGLNSSQAERIADSVIVRLVLPQPAQG
jgi:hypothetical protein